MAFLQINDEFTLKGFDNHYSSYINTFLQRILVALNKTNPKSLSAALFGKPTRRKLIFEGFELNDGIVNDRYILFIFFQDFVDRSQELIVFLAFSITDTGSGQKKNFFRERIEIIRFYIRIPLYLSL